MVLRILIGPASRCRPLSLLIAQKRLSRLGPLIEAAPPGVPVYVAAQAVMDAIVGFPIHRGVLALGLRPPEPGAQTLLAALAPPALALVLLGVSNHDNMGGLFRNAAAFGAGAVVLDAACCDPLYRKAIRVSAGASLAVPFARLAAGEDPLATLAAAGFTALALTPRGQAPTAGLARPARKAILLGAEGPGLPDTILSRSRTVAIPMAPGWDSLNVAAASAVVLHELTRPAAPLQEPPAGQT